MVGLPEVSVAVVLLDIDDVIVQLLLEAQAEFFNPLGNDGRAADQRRSCQAFVDHDLAGAQHALFLAFGISHAFARGRLGRGKYGLHDRAGGIHKALQPFAVRIHVLDGPQGHAAISRRFRHRRRNLHHQAWVKGLGNQVVGTEGQLFADIGRRHHFALLGLRQFGNRMDGGNFHLDGDG